MDSQSAPANLAWPFPFRAQDWEHTPTAVQAYVHTLHNELTQLRERVEALEARLQADSTTSQRPPSSDSPYKKPRQRSTTTPRRKAGGKPGHPGHRQALLAPTTVQELRPERCAWGGYPFNTGHFVTSTPYCEGLMALPRTRQVIDVR
jgi:transposase